MVEILETSKMFKNNILGRKMGRKIFEFSIFLEKSRKISTLPIMLLIPF